MAKPIVDIEKCTGCGSCVSVCPEQVFELKDGKSEVVYPEKCIDCKACENSCPEQAIVVEE